MPVTTENCLLLISLSKNDGVIQVHLYYNSGNGPVCLSVCLAIESKTFAPIGTKFLTRVAGPKGLPVEKKEN